MTIKERYTGVISYFQKHMPVAETELHYTNPFELLVAVILSAQCTDKRVNMVTPALFQRFPDALSMSMASQEELFGLIRSISYPNNKAKHLLEMAKMLIEIFKNNIPDNVNDLQKLPGVGRKTANVIASVIYNKPTMAVDTHVFRVANRIGLTNKAKNPLQSEMQLVKHLPEEIIPTAHHWLILHGRYICLARTPQCAKCGIQEFCKHYQSVVKKKKVT